MSVVKDENRSGKKNGKLGGKWKIWLAAGVLALAVCGLAAAGGKIWTGYRDSIIDQQKEQMFLTAKSMGENLEFYIEECAADLDGIYRMAKRKGTGQQPDWSIVQDYVQAHSPMIYDVVVEDSQGQMVESFEGHRVETVSSVSKMDEDTSLMLATVDDGNRYLMIRRQLPEGALSMMIHLQHYYELLIRDLKVGSSGYVLVKDSDGVILVHPDPAQWGIQVIDGRRELYPDADLGSLEQMIDNQLAGKSGVEEYYSYWWVEPDHPRVRKICAYVPVPVGEDFLVLSEVMDYEDISVPIAQGTLRLALFFFVIFGLLAAMIFYMFYLMVQKKKDREQIAYLTELNRLLEDMHRSEETIAHQQRLQIMGTMTGGIAHEFNNLLTPIMGYADLLLMDLPEDSEDYENALEIYEASAKAKEMIQQISSFSRKNMETAYKLSDGAAILKRAMKMVKSICPANVTLREEISLGREKLLCNETQINQVLLNICVNAVHAIGHGEGNLTVTASVQERSQLETEKSLPEGWDSYVHIRISDDGCGMSPEVLSQIFDPFFTTKKGGQGTGLGLALAEQIIHSHKGEIYAESQPEKGSTFHILLPVSGERMPVSEERMSVNKDRLTEGEEDQPLPGDGKEAAGGPWQSPGRDPKTAKVSGPRILVVDDNPKILNLLEKDAQRLKLPLASCMDYEAALRLLEGGAEFDMIAAEQEIGGKGVTDFLMAVQSRWPGVKIYVMLDRMTREIAQAKQRGLLDACIDKPVSIASFLDAYRKEGRLNSL